MQTGYLVIAKDGKEYGPLDRDTIQQWYHESRLDQNSRVYEPGKHKFRLKEMFDLAVWSNPLLISEAAAKATAQPVFNPKTNIIAVPNERTPGMLMAACLLLALGMVEVLPSRRSWPNDSTPRGARCLSTCLPPPPTWFWRRVCLGAIRGFGAGDWVARCLAGS
jgi:hypothetical protein